MSETKKIKCEPDVSLVQAEAKAIQAVLCEFARGLGTRFISGLVDCHLSPSDTPTSTVAGLDGYIVPQLFPNAMNCGMALFRIDLKPSLVESKKDEIVSSIHNSLLKESRVLNDDQLNSVLTRGAEAFIEIFLPNKTSQRNRILLDGKSNIDCFLKKRIDKNKIVPRHVQLDKSFACFPGNHIEGNHFLEFYREYNPASGSLEANHTICGFHFGTRFGKELNRFFLGPRAKHLRGFYKTRSLRRKAKKTVRLISKSKTDLKENFRFHLESEGIDRLMPIIKHYLISTRICRIPVHTPEGQRYIGAQAYGFNHSAAARISFMEYIARQLSKCFNKAIEWEIIWESGHDNPIAETHDGETIIVSRKGALPVAGLSHGFIAGNFNVPSLLVASNNDGFSPPWWNSYDHGMGALLNNEKRENYSGADLGVVTLYRPVGTQATSDFNLERENVFESKTISKMSEIYKIKKAPVTPVKWLIPFINYKYK